MFNSLRNLKAMLLTLSDRPLTTRMQIRTLQAFGSGKGEGLQKLNNAVHDIVSSVWQHTAALVRVTKAVIKVAIDYEDEGNRVGWTRITREGSLIKLGFFTEWTAESMQFDSDSMLKEHLAREMLNGAYEIYEDVLQRDLIAGAGVVVYSGAATSKATITGVVTPASGINPQVPASIVDYTTLMRLDLALTDNRTPTHTQIITGSRYQDTKVVDSARYMYVGSELMPLLRTMKDNFGNKAFIEAKHYADGGTLAEGEVGAIDGLRIIMVPEMLHYAGAGQSAPAGTPYRTTNVGGQSKFNVYPMLVVGDDSFVTLGFQSDGASGRFTIKTKMPNVDITADDPYAEIGRSSIKWYYGNLIKRPERIAVVYTVAPI